MVVCILFYPYDGEQAWVEFFDLKVLTTSSDPDVKTFCKVIGEALKDPQLIATTSLWPADLNLTGNMQPPCQVDLAITIYLET